MGVLGWTRLLTEAGLLPPSEGCGCSASLFRSYSSSSDRLVPLAPHSKLHIDGNGLVFFLFRAAYARNLQQGYGTTSATSDGKCVGRNDDACLPTFLPLTLLHQVCYEWASTLLHYPCQLVVYWDGPQRPIYKQGTDRKRQKDRAQQWSHLQVYCDGHLPTVSCCEWPLHFPISRLCWTTVQYCLHIQLKISRVDCPGEADAVIAQQAALHQNNSYVVGSDSDYTIMKGISYIPFSSLTIASSPGNALSLSPNMLYAYVLRRVDLVHAFYLHDESSLVEVALCLGNDFVPRYGSFSSACDCVAYIQAQSPGFRLTAREVVATEQQEVSATSASQIEQAMDFCRRWYNLEEIRSGEKEAVHDNDDDEDDEAGDMIVIHHNHQASPNSGEPKLPLMMNLKLARVKSFQDGSVKDVVLRCLQSYLDHHPGDEVLTQIHVNVLHNMTVRSGLPDVGERWRPTWQDMTVCFWVEKLFVKAMDSCRDSPLAKLFPITEAFDALTYLRLLFKACPPIARAGISAPQKEPAKVERQSLPVDEHKDTILQAIQAHRVVIIQGATGCGKSSRIPIMLLRAPPPVPALKQVKMFISQPRRIAAKALVERVRSVEPDLSNKIALRMGHGVREYESPSTRAWFVTTGYLVRLLANNPARFNSVSHLIIDEVHERSVDTDILCLLCRRLLATNPHIRLVLMSATLAASLYQQYFKVQHPVIQVGSRRFPVQEVFLEDMEELGGVRLPPNHKKKIQSIIAECSAKKCLTPPSNSFMEKVYQLVSYLATVIGSPGSSVMIFVPGMNDIVAISELIEQVYIAGVRFTCFPIHSDIPFEEQMRVFDATVSDEIKIVIATNAAESSVTLPDVDHVICLGLCKHIIYNPSSHRQMLLPAWISKASATQRAGRTGRVRPGTVFRLYTREVFESWMEPFEPGEMVRIPLDSVILMLKEMLDGELVTDVLLDCLEPPEVSTIGQSFQSLYRSHFITSPSDESAITTLGKFVSALGIDLMLGSLIGLGIQFGVGPEAIEMAAVLSFPKSPWIISNSLIHEPRDFNEQSAKTYISKCNFDANLFSEPLAIMNLLWEFELANKKANKWCQKYGVFHPRLIRLKTTRDNLRGRVADFLGISDECIRAEFPPLQMPHAKITILRVIQSWVFHDSVIECRPEKFSQGLSGSSYGIVLGKESAVVGKEHLYQILCKERHPFELKGYSEVQKKGSFGLVEKIEFSFAKLEERLISYMTENNAVLCWCDTDDYFSIYADEGFASSEEFSFLIETVEEHLREYEVAFVVQNTGRSCRGLAERPCGKWLVAFNDSFPKSSKEKRKWRVYRCKRESFTKKKWKLLVGQLVDFTKSKSLRAISLSISQTGPQSRESKFEITSRNTNITVSDRDLRDMFGAFTLVVGSSQQKSGGQHVLFDLVESAPLDSTPGNLTNETQTSWERAPFKNLPEGARVLSALASNRRNGHFLRLYSFSENDGSEEDMEDHLDIYPDGSQTNLIRRWRRFGTEKSVYVDSNSVPATSIPLQRKGTLYCLCANMLEVRGGGVRVEGLTLLPPGRLFFLLCQLTFGLNKVENVEDGNLSNVLKSLAIESEESVVNSNDWLRRIEAAVAFNESSEEIGETLECYPSKIKELLIIFNGVDGYEMAAWSSLSSNPFINANLRKHQANNSKK